MLAMIDISLLIAAGASFVIGAAGYIIVRFWMVPIMRYRSAKRKLKRELYAFMQSIDQVPSDIRRKPTAGSGENQLKRARQHAMEMADHYSHQIPVWYRLLLDSRGESPSKASDLLSNLGKIKDLPRRHQRIRKACSAIGLK